MYCPALQVHPKSQPCMVTFTHFPTALLPHFVVLANTSSALLNKPVIYIVTCIRWLLSLSTKLF